MTPLLASDFQLYLVKLVNNVLLFSSFPVMHAPG